MRFGLNHHLIKQFKAVWTNSRPFKSRTKQGNMTPVFIYNGKGSGEDSRHLFHESLLDALDPAFHNVEFISAEEIIKGNWTNDAKVLCFGGGYDRGFLESLGPSGLRTIREYVHRGGNYLGMCAGAYFACDYIEFDKDGPLEVVGSRNLKFYPGKCIGPAFPGFKYNSKRGVHAVPISYRNSLTVNTYMHGGGYFLHDACFSSDNEDVEVLGKYETLKESPAAVVKCKVGQGCAILSGVHLEFQAQCLEKENDHLKKLMTNFMEADIKRNVVFRDILVQLGLSLRDSSPRNQAIPQATL